MKCPGQDTRYWTGEVAFDEPCPKCGSVVEFFKDESSGRCSKCGHRFSNPRVSFDCAKWCAYAEECVGVVPERDSVAANPGDGAFASRLLGAAKDAYAMDPARLACALSAFQYARELLSAEGGDPRIVLAAALLMDTDTHAPSAEGHDLRARRVLEEIGLDADTTACVCHLLKCHMSNEPLDTVESRIVSDARALAALATAQSESGREKTGSCIEQELQTETAKQKIRSLK